MRMRAQASLFALALVAGPAAGQTTVPAIHIHMGAEELMQSSDPERYESPTRLAEDVRWVRDRADDLVRWWERDGPVFLARAADFAGLSWPYRDIEVYLVRNWSVISIEYPLVVALDSIDARSSIPDDDDFRILLLAHQISHYLLDPPAFVPERQWPRAYEHPFMAPGNFEREAMVNWVVYAVLEEMWGRRRLDRATGQELWRMYNPNHDYVVNELLPRWRLGPDRTLVQWLAATPRDSEIFRIHEAYVRQRREPEPAPGPAQGATPYGIDLAATFERQVFVAFVDRASPADRAGVQQGDILMTIEGRPVGREVVEARQRLDASWEDNGEINLSVERGGREVFLTVRRR